nr:hypothetical protein [Thiocapsa roseopersicina]
MPPAHTLEAAFRAGPLGATGRDAEDDDAADADAAPSDVRRLSTPGSRNLPALQGRAEQGLSAFEQRQAERLGEAGQRHPPLLGTVVPEHDRTGLVPMQDVAQRIRDDDRFGQVLQRRLKPRLALAQLRLGALALADVRRLVAGCCR